MSDDQDEFNPKWPSLKFIAVGHGAMGKTCMLLRYFRNEFPEQYIPTVFDNVLKHLEYEGQMYNMACWDTAGGEDYPRLRPLSYPGTDAFLLLHNVNSHRLFEDIETYWWPELKHHCPGVPVILVGSKVDLRDENSLSFEEGRKMAEKIGAACYMECSSLEDIGVSEVFQQAVKLGSEYQKTEKNKKKRKKCNLL